MIMSLMMTRACWCFCVHGCTGWIQHQPSCSLGSDLLPPCSQLVQEVARDGGERREERGGLGRAPAAQLCGDDFHRSSVGCLPGRAFFAFRVHRVNLRLAVAGPAVGSVSTTASS